MTSWIDNANAGSWDTETTGMDERGYVSCPSRNRRYWMPSDTEREIVFLDESPTVAMWEHSLKIGNDYRNFATCLSHLGKPCPLCGMVSDKNVSKYRVMPFTIIDTHPFTIKRGEKAGEVVKNSKRLLMAKSGFFERLARKMKRLKDKGVELRMAKFLVSRSSDNKAPSTGDDLEFVETADPAEFDDVEVYDYADLLSPNPDLVAQYLTQLRGAEASESSFDDTEDTTLPF